MNEADYRVIDKAANRIAHEVKTINETLALASVAHLMLQLHAANPEVTTCLDIAQHATTKLAGIAGITEDILPNVKP